MDVITIESKAYKEIVAKIDVIANYVFSQEDTKNEDEIWVDSYEVCTFLQISDRTLQRLRAKGVVAFSNIGGRCYYKIGELKRLLEERLIKSNDECMRNLITNHELYAKERRNTKQDTACRCSNTTCPATGASVGTSSIRCTRTARLPATSILTDTAACTR